METTEQMSESSGVTETVESAETEDVEAKAPTEKPWIAAGFKSRSEWRASKKSKTEETVESKEHAKKPVKAASVKKPGKKTDKKPGKAKERKVKKPGKVKVKAKGKNAKKHNYPQTAAERRKAAERTAAFKKSLMKKEEPNENELKILRSVKVGGETSIEKLAQKFSGPAAKRKSQVRNALRWVIAVKKFKKIDRGTYRRVA